MNNRSNKDIRVHVRQVGIFEKKWENLLTFNFKIKLRYKQQKWSNHEAAPCNNQKNKNYLIIDQLHPAQVKAIFKEVSTAKK